MSSLDLICHEKDLEGYIDIYFLVSVLRGSRGWLSVWTEIKKKKRSRSYTQMDKDLIDLILANLDININMLNFLFVNEQYHKWKEQIFTSKRYSTSLEETI